MDSVESAVRRRINALAHRPEPAPWGPVPYNPNYLAALPAEIVRRDFGCGDPTKFLKPGDTVIDLGSGSGKGAFVAAQVVGPDGWVIGVDCHRDLLALSSRHLDEFSERVGFTNIDFRCGLIQDLRLDLDELGALLAACPISDQWGYLELRDIEDRLRREDPLIDDASVSAVICNGTLGLVRGEDQPRVAAEMARCLQPDGRAILCDLAPDADLPASLRNDPTFWSQGLGGCLGLDSLERLFRHAGFADVQVAERSEAPAHSVRGIDFRLVTVIASRPGPA